jgi:hypothetical protein
MAPTCRSTPTFALLANSRVSIDGTQVCLAQSTRHVTAYPRSCRAIFPTHLWEAMVREGVSEKMTTSVKSVTALTVSDLVEHPVWEYVNNEIEFDELAVRPVAKTPVRSLSGRIVGRQVQLANHSLVWATLANIVANNPRLTEHFLTVSIERKGEWFTMARYHDIDAGRNGPKAVAAFLGLPISQVFFHSIRHPAPLFGR